MALRVLPSLSLAVTDDAVRKRKRLVMFVPGLVAFGVYRLAKHVVPLTEPMVWVAGALPTLPGIAVTRDLVVTAMVARCTSKSSAWM